MKIGLPKEIKENEYRVAIIPSNVGVLVNAGHEVYVQKDAGAAAGYTDAMYEAVGATILETEPEVWKAADLIIKVKEMLPSQFDLLEERHTLFTYIHSSNRRPQTEALLNSKCVALAYEDVKDENGRFPLLEPMSRMAGEVGLLTGIFYSFTTEGGLGKLVCGNPGIKPMKIVIFGAGNVGVSAARLGLGLNADVVLMDIDLKKLEDVIANKLPGVRTLYSNRANVEQEIKDADIVFNCVKWFPGLKIITRDMLKLMQPKSLIVDIDAEPGGAIETSQYSTHENAVFEVDGIRHIGIANLPSAVANSASAALSNATIKYIMALANKGWKQATMDDESLRYGLDFVKGYLTFKDTADAFDIPLTDKQWIYDNF